MPSASRSLRLTAGLLLSALLVAACCIDASNPAAAFGRGGFGGGFGRMGGGGTPMMGGDGMRGRTMMGPRRGVGRVVGGHSGSGTHYRGGGTRHTIVGPGLDGDGGVIVSDGAQRGGGNSRNSRGSGVPARGERRFVADEIVVEFSPGATAPAIDQLARRYNLTQLETQSFPLIGSTFSRWRLPRGRSVPDLVGVIEDDRAVASAQPNYLYILQEDAAKSPAAAHGEAAQYVLGKLQVEQAHHVATGKNILVAVIDSQIDARHPDLDGSIAQSVDELGGGDNPPEHGTAIAGAIAAHGKLLGIAPGVRLFAVRAFDDAPGKSMGTSFAIYKSLQSAADGGARVVNMSFVGPPDPDLHRLLAAAYAKDMVLIAAAGNAGPDSAPLYPAADPDVIAVTASDSRDALFKMANRGAYIAVASPGVEILALAPGHAYQIATGTSVAAAHVSGIVALLLELKPSLKPKDIRTILMATAKPHADFGAGLVNAYRAVIGINGRPAGKDDAQAKQ
jgi:subtilase family protein/fervidolysin-like protein